MNLVERCKQDAPWHYRWERFKLAVTEFVAKYFRVHNHWETKDGKTTLCLRKPWFRRGFFRRRSR